MSNITLYEISHDMATITDDIIDAEGELTPELERRLDECGLALTVKAEGIWMVLRNMEANNSVIDTEIKRLQKIKKIRNNATDRLKTYIKRCMEDANLKKIDTPLGGFTIRKSPASVEIIDESIIPFDLMVVIPETQRPDKKAISDALKKGEDVKGAKLITDKTSLQVK